MLQITKLRCWLSAALFLAVVGCSSVRPLCRSDESIRASLLKQTPLGTSSDRVYAFITEQRWPIYRESRDAGFTMHLPGRNEAHSPVVGSSFVACKLGTTHFVMFPFETMKYAYWGFDKSGHLVEIWVDQDTGAL
jgi:hypothetical protein